MIHVYVGPTLSRADVLSHCPQAVLHDPVAHGDLLRTRFTRADIVLIIDGYFRQVGSVRHKEILSLLADRVRVVGCSSMGALRAAELHPYGVVGSGEVFRMYRDGVIEADDEVAVAHGEGPDFRRLSEPLVNIRHLLARAQHVGTLSPDAAREVWGVAAGMHYVQRSWRAVETVACRRAPGLHGQFSALAAMRAADPDVADVKAADARRTLGALQETAEQPRSLDWAGSDEWRTRFLTTWQATFGGTDVDGVHVGDADVIQYQRLYHPAFPQRWRAAVLDKIGTAVGKPVPERAVAYWTTARERAALPAAEVGRLVLVRSYRPRRLLSDLISAFPDLIDEPACRAVAEAGAVNAEVASRPRSGGRGRLRSAVLRKHLAGRWRIDSSDEAGLDAAARDRGFSSVTEASEASRSFFLREHVRSSGPAGAAR